MKRLSKYYAFPQGVCVTKFLFLDKKMIQGSAE